MDWMLDHEPPLWVVVGMLRGASLIADEAINEGWCGDGDDD